MRRLSVASLVMVVVSLASASPVMAQGPGRGDVAMSYSLLYDGGLSDSLPGTSGLLPAGWLFSASARATGNLSIVGEIGVDYRSVTIEDVDLTLGVHGYFGGVRYAPTLGTRVQPFAQAMVGDTHASITAMMGRLSHDAFTTQLGGGVDVDATAHVAVRLQGDYRIIDGDGGITSELRLATGVVYRF